MATLFISDLHLDASRPRITQLFLDFMKQEPRQADAVYILGDFFEVWLGDDDPDPHHAQVMDAVRELTDSGVPVYFMHGNRDFLIGTDFAKRTGVQLLPDPTVVELSGIPTLLMHGDTLCTDDVEYQAFRKLVRDPVRQKAFLASPLAERRAFVTHARAASGLSIAQKSESIMDVNQQAVETVMREHGVDRLIHGHTHRPATHKLQSDGEHKIRIVLGDWYHQGSILRVTGTEPVLATLPLTQ
ncbi:MAG TPA: UDP-2,3-diacylglucosamine diphosphatase [Gammaproteobacteria bacterium]|nr:UDP-2,3-diacylglucosamine diphosphatase [Gammaproteobacteria bacterium]